MYDEMRELVACEWRSKAVDEPAYADWFKNTYQVDGFENWHYSAAARLGVLPNNNPIESYHKASSDTSVLKKGAKVALAKVTSTALPTQLPAPAMHMA